MRHILIIVSIFLFSFTIISCAKKSSDDSSSSGSTTSSGTTTNPIQLSDVKANLSGKNLFITTASSGSSSGRSSRSAFTSTTSDDNTSTTSTKSLITIDNNSVIDYGIISDYDLEIEQVRADPNNEYAYVLMKYGGFPANQVSIDNLLALNCTIFKVNYSNNEMNCVEPGLIVTDTKTNMINGVNDYHLDYFQWGTENTFVFRTIFDERFTAKSDLTCSKSCIYGHNTETGVTRRISPYSYEGERFVALGDGNIVWSGLETNGNFDSNTTYDNEILLTDTQGDTIELTSSPNSVFAGDFQGGDYKTAFWGSETQNKVVFARLIDGTVRKTFIINENYRIGVVIKGHDGNIYLQSMDQFAKQGLYSLLPFKINPIISIPELWSEKLLTTNCSGSSGTCGGHFTIVNGIVFYNNYAVNSNIESYELKATRISDNSTVTLLKPNSSCTDSCYNFKIAGDQTDLAYRWFLSNSKLYVPMKDINLNKIVVIEINTTSIDFDATDNQVQIMSSLDDYTGNRVAKDISGINTVDNSSLNPTAEIKHEDNETISVRIEFNKKMNYSDVESKVSIIDNSSSSVIGFMPVWNNKTLHLVVDTDNGTSSTVESNPLTSGTTYKVSLLGTAKDSDGNALGSDVVKYITP